jgi:hypothetical protein
LDGNKNTHYFINLVDRGKIYLAALWLWALCEKLCISFAVIFYRKHAKELRKDLKACYRDAYIFLICKIYIGCKGQTFLLVEVISSGMIV